MDRFCYLGDMLSVDGDADAAVDTEQTARFCVQNFAAVRRAVSEEIANRHVSQLSDYY